MEKAYIIVKVEEDLWGQAEPVKIPLLNSEASYFEDLEEEIALETTPDPFQYQVGVKKEPVLVPDSIVSLDSSISCPSAPLPLHSPIPRPVPEQRPSKRARTLPKRSRYPPARYNPAIYQDIPPLNWWSKIID